MNTFPLVEDRFLVVERYPRGQETVVAAFDSEDMAQTWLDTFLRQMNLNGLVQWTRRQTD